MFCSACANKVNEFTTFCPGCGNPISLYAELQPGTLILNKYEVLQEKITETQFSKIYKAKDIIQTQELVSVKEHKPSPKATPSQRSEDTIQHRYEASFLKQINSPFVVKFLDAAIHNGKHLIIMEYINGPTLKEYKALRGKLSEQETIKLGKDILAGLIAIHGAKIIMRDIKLHNLIYDFNIVKHIDFGIATKADRKMPENLALFHTIYYSAPEQRRGEETYYTSDIFSVSASLLMVMVESSINETQLDTQLQIKNGNPLNVEDVIKLCPNMTRKFAGYIARGMNPDHRKRWETAEKAYLELCSI